MEKVINTVNVPLPLGKYVAALKTESGEILILVESILTALGKTDSWLVDAEKFLFEMEHSLKRELKQVLLCNEEIIAITKRGCSLVLSFAATQGDDMARRVIIEGIDKSALVDPISAQRVLSIILRSPVEKKNITSSSNSDELKISKKLALSLKGRTEVEVPSGRIDVLTKTEVIEVKSAEQWKSAIGQVLTYSAYYPKCQPRIHLFGKVNLKQKKVIEFQCDRLGVVLTWEKN